MSLNLRIIDGVRNPNGFKGRPSNAYLSLLNQLKIERVHVIAISSGGPSGIIFASQYPERVRSLNLQSGDS